MISTMDRQRIFIFVGITYGITIAVTLGIFFTGGVDSNFTPKSAFMSIVMFTVAYAPALANIATRLITREGWSNTFLRPNLRRGWPFYLAAFTIPLLAIILGGAIYFLLFPGSFDPTMGFARQAGKILANDTPASVIRRKVIESSVLITFGAVFLFIGEEFGWRAYLLPKLMPLGSRKAVLLTGVIWGMFHWPWIFMGFHYGVDYWGAPVVGPLLFVLIITCPSILYSWMTLRTGSVWPACIAHAGNNAFFSLWIYFLIRKPDVLIGPGPEGIVGCLGYVLLGLPILLIPRALAPVDKALSRDPSTVEKVVEKVKLGTIS